MGSLSDVDDQVELVLNSKEKQKHILLQRILKEVEQMFMILSV